MVHSVILHWSVFTHIPIPSSKDATLCAKSIVFFVVGVGDPTNLNRDGC